MSKTKKILVKLLIVVMVMAMMPAAAFGAISSDDFVDMPNDWSTDALEKAVDNGLISGFDENGYKYIKPASILTRAQMATIVNRAFGAVNKATLTGVRDVPSSEWHYTELQKAVEMGTFKLDTYMRPNDPITRQEAFTVLARAFKLVDKDNNRGLANFSDGSTVASYARDAVCAMIDSRYVAGSGGYLLPTSNITRAEFAKVMDNLVEKYVSTSGTTFSTSSLAGNLLVNKGNTTIRNTIVKGDLIIGDGVGSGDVTLDNVDVTGNILVRGGGTNTITIRGNCDVNTMTVAKVTGNVRIEVLSGADITTANLDEGENDIILEGKYGTVNINGELEVYLNNAEIRYVQVNETSTITLDDDTEVDRITVDDDAPNTRIINNGLVDLLRSDVKVYVTGSGTITENLALTGTSPITSIGSITGTPRVGSELSAGAVKPSSATVNYQWKIANTANGTYTNISGATKSTYTPVAANVNKYLKVTVTGRNNYSGTLTSNATSAIAASKITATNIPGVTVPVAGAVPVKTLASTDEYTATISWAPNHTVFEMGTVYTATVVLEPKTGYTTTGILVNQFKITGATATNPVNSGTIKAVFPATSAGNATGISPVVTPVTPAEEDQVMLSVGITPADNHYVYYRVVTSNPGSMQLGTVINPGNWTEFPAPATLQITAVDGRYIEVVEVNANNEVTRWGKTGQTSDGYVEPEPVPASELTVSVAPLAEPVLSTVQLVSVSGASSSNTLYYKVASSAGSPPDEGTNFGSSGWIMISSFPVTDVAASDGSYILVTEVDSESKITGWGASEATLDGVTE